MSHFTVLVIGDNIEEQMEPYAEQDFDEKYGVFNDIEQESKEEYQTEDIEVIMLNDGTMLSRYDNQFRTRDGSDYIYPKNSIKKTVSMSEFYPTFEVFMEKYHGHKNVDEKKGVYGYWSNPNAKYDYWTVGGRWSGFFKLKPGTRGELGSPSSFGNKANSGHVDHIRLCDIDIDGMKFEKQEEAHKTYDKLEKILNGRPLPSWKAIREKNGDDIQAGREEYHNLEVVKDLNQAQFWSMGDLTETFCNSREEYVKKQVNSTLITYAVVKDGKWYQKGEMGWFGMSSDEMIQDQWNEQVWNILNELLETTPETKITLLDCHI